MCCNMELVFFTCVFRQMENTCTTLPFRNTGESHRVKSMVTAGFEPANAQRMGLRTECSNQLSYVAGKGLIT